MATAGQIRQILREKAHKHPISRLACGLLFKKASDEFCSVANHRHTSTRWTAMTMRLSESGLMRAQNKARRESDATRLRAPGRCTNFGVRRLRPQSTLYVRGRGPISEISRYLGEWLPALMRYIRTYGGQSTGPVFSRTHTVLGGIIDLEAGIPVAVALPGQGPIRAGELPGGDVATATHYGPHSGIAVTTRSLSNWVWRIGRTTAGSPWTVYVTDPADEPDPVRWRTDIYLPLVR
jgi:effector-binding domain-containing protein